MRKTVGRAALAVAVLWGPGAARGNIAAPTARPSGLGAAVVGPSTLAVDDETLLIRCHPRGDEPVCDVAAEYLVTNRGDGAVGGVGAFYGLRTEDIVVTVDGRPTSAFVDATTQSILDASMARVSEVARRAISDGTKDMTRQGFSLRVAPGASSTLRLSGTLRSQVVRRSGEVRSPMEGRHPLSHVGHDRASEHSFVYWLSPLRTWSGAHRVHLRLVVPSGWPVRIDLRTREALKWRTLTSASGTHQWQEELSADDVDAIEIAMENPATPREWGAPWLGFGAVLGSHAASGIGLRAGFEMSSPSYLVHALTADIGCDNGRFGDRLAVAVQTEAATPHVLALPGLSLGAGIALEMRPSLAVGGRVLAGLQFRPVGALVSVDYFPSKTADDGRMQVGIFGRASF